jgi:hypothetical protein
MWASDLPIDDSCGSGTRRETAPADAGIEEAVMRRTMVVGVLVGAAVLVGSSAQAAPPEITAASCEETGGTFARERGVKSCTRVSQVEVPRPAVTLSEAVPSPSFSQYIGVSRRIDTVRTTTVQSQKGSGEVTSRTTSAIVSSRVEQISCTYRSVSTSGGGIFGGSTTTVSFLQRPLSECVGRGVYVTA